MMVFWQLGCATSTENPKKEKWLAVMNSAEFQREKVIFLERSKGVEICWNKGVEDFLFSNSAKPDPKCLYPASKTSVERINAKPTLQRSINKLRVLAIAENGFIVNSPSVNAQHSIYVYKTNEKDIVDGSFLDGAEVFNFYEYMGVFQYEALFGMRTVHSFRKITNENYKATQDLKVYRPSTEYFIKNELWDWLN